MAISFVGGALIERVVIRPVEQSSPLVIVIVTIGLFLAINSLAQFMFGSGQTHAAERLPAPHLAAGRRADLVRHARARRACSRSSACCSTSCSSARSSASRSAACRGNPESSRLLGVPVGRILMVGWGLAAAVGALAGALVDPDHGRARAVVDAADPRVRVRGGRARRLRQRVRRGRRRHDRRRRRRAHDRLRPRAARHRPDRAVRADPARVAVPAGRACSARRAWSGCDDAAQQRTLGLVVVGRRSSRC